jgi:hypothetical protein
MIKRLLDVFLDRWGFVGSIEYAGLTPEAGYVYEALHEIVHAVSFKLPVLTIETWSTLNVTVSHLFDIYRPAIQDERELHDVYASVIVAAQYGIVIDVDDFMGNVDWQTITPDEARSAYAKIRRNDRMKARRVADRTHRFIQEILHAYDSSEDTDPGDPDLTRDRRRKIRR